MSWDDRTDRFKKDFERNPHRTAWKWFIGIVATLVLVTLFLSGTGLLTAWFSKGADVVSPRNVEEQYRYVIRDYEALYSASGNACTVVSSMNENSPTFVESPETAYAATFRKIVADYNRRMDNIFEAGIVGPPGYPDEVPRSLGTDGDWCNVPAELDRLRAESK